MSLMLSLVTPFFLFSACTFFFFVILPRFNPLSDLPGPRVRGWFGNRMSTILDPVRSFKAHEVYTRRFGRTMRIQGITPWDQRLLTLDPVSISYVLKHTTIFEKPWESREIITNLIGRGMLAAEGSAHKRQRRVITPSFSAHNMRALVPLVFRKGEELKERWMGFVREESKEEKEESNIGVTLDVAHWVSRATFDVIGIAGFDYHFNAIQSESNELFSAYKEMFEVAVSQTGCLRSWLGVYLPFIFTIFPDRLSRTVQRCQEVIYRVANQLIQEKKRKIAEDSVEKGHGSQGKDLLTLLMKSNVAQDLPEDQRISDADILYNINTFMFAGSDTSSLGLTWTLLLLAQNPLLQTRLREELLSIAPHEGLITSALSDEEILSLYDSISTLPYLHNVVRESLRLVPPVHSSLRVATQTEEIPTMYPVLTRAGVDNGRRSVTVPKGSYIHVAIEGFNLDQTVWGEDAWVFNPDRWDDLPSAVLSQPGTFFNTMTFSAGPRSCIGIRFSTIEIKSFLYILLTNFVFKEAADCRIFKSNVVLTRPYVAGRYKEGSQCPIQILPYVK